MYMKNVFLTFMILTFSLSSILGFSQETKEPEALGLPGDNLNLYAVLALFQSSKTIEDFETSLNKEDMKINNLDLNNDKKTDFIKVVSKKDGEAFTFVLEVVVTKDQIQDVAVIDVDKSKDGKVTVQIIGDEVLYGKNYIVEPAVKSGTPNPAYTGTDTVVINNNITNNNTTINEVQEPVDNWPVVNYMYSPMYMPYYSPWYWGYYPPYWRPWVPIYYRNYWGYHNHYYGNPYYRRTVVVVNPHHYNNYYSNRSSSTVVINNNKQGYYKDTYNGRDYTKPATRPTNPTTRPTTPSTRPVSPTTRPTNSTTRPTTPSTRPVSPTTRPVTPTTRPTSPSTRPASPSTRPNARPATRATGMRTSR